MALSADSAKADRLDLTGEANYAASLFIGPVLLLVVVCLWLWDLAVRLVRHLRDAHWPEFEAPRYSADAPIESEPPEGDAPPPHRLY